MNIKIRNTTRNELTETNIKDINMVWFDTKPDYIQIIGDTILIEMPSKTTTVTKNKKASDIITLR